MELSKDIKEIAKALNKLQSEMEFALKSEQAFKYKYADMAAIWGVLKEPLTSNGLMITQDAFTLEQGTSVQTMVIHAESGEWIKSGILTVPGDKTAHSCGSALTYGKRYQLTALLGIQTDQDDDGNAAQKESLKPQPKPKPKVIVKPFSADDMCRWLEKWSDKYPLADLQDYCEARSKHLEHSTEQTCAELAKDEILFVRNIDIWLKRQAKDEDIPQ